VSGLPPTPDTADPRIAFQELTAEFESPVPPDSDVYVALKPILEGNLPKGLGDDVNALDLESPAQVQAFDESLLPLLEEALEKPYFAPDTKLQATGFGTVDYRGIRTVVNLITTRADQLWSQGEREEAVDLLELPLNLSVAMQSRPETASVNLFSSGYAEAAVSLAQEWLESPDVKPDTVDELAEALEEASPSYPHLQETVTVDFAQLYNSLETEEGRSQLGIGQVQDTTLQAWNSQLLAIHGEASRLYDTRPMDPAAFNKTVLDASGPIQGLVIDYPEVATMQKHAFAKYKATELGLALLGSRGESLRELPSDKMIETVFQENLETAQVLKNLLEVSVDEERIRIEGRDGQFELLVPGVNPVFFQHRLSQ
jgi:hypothetical protein